ncbi:MAG: tyrosine--tRNA ligase [Nitrospinaceae bacterium]|nr:tyrosine--tRNA ligase [Nitrospinaceae bacterium]
MDIIEELKWRGLLADCTDEKGLKARLQSNPITLYVGFDPTADSLHVGSLVPLLALRRFQNAGHHPIAVAGGATGLIGDPSGRATERALPTKELIEERLVPISAQLKLILDFETQSNPARVVNNADWITPITFIDFLRDIGKHFSVNMMVAKESVRSRMEDRDSGISFTEFSYMLLQAYDFYHLRKDAECELQVGGSDQWGNITAGIDLCRRQLGKEAFGLTLPLITKSDGTKFGKSVDGAIWLDKEKTSVYKFYQFWIRADDRDIIPYLKFFTFLEKEKITDLEEKHQTAPHRREAHQTLAVEMTNLIHGADATRDAIKASEILFGGSMEGISESLFEDVVGEVPTVKLPVTELNDEGIWLPELLERSGICNSRGQGRKDIKGGGIYLNNNRISDDQKKVTFGDLLFGKHVLLRKGKRNYSVATFQ